MVLWGVFYTKTKFDIFLTKPLESFFARLYNKNSGKPFEEVEKDTDRDNYLSAEDAKEYGLIDEIFFKRP